MPQDNLRAAVHRSLNKTLQVICEDRIDTAECGTIGRTKTSPSVDVEPPVHERSGRRGLDSLAYGCGEGEEAMSYREDCELQLHQVSRGANKLSQMMQSWSKAPGLDERSRDAAQDLLQGALDLQESLVMLGKLQKATKLMSTKKKQKGQLMEERRRDEMEVYVEEMRSRRYAASGYYPNGLQEARLSVDATSRKCVEELKQVIRDSFRRQNLVSVSSDDEKGSSSRSLRFPASIGFMDASYKSKERKETCAAESKMVRAPNLIAKLMGLEEVPPKNVNLIKMEEEEEEEKSLKHKRPSFDIEMPRLRNFQLVEKNLDYKRKTLDEVIQTMQFKGLLKSDCTGMRSRASDTARFECYTRDVAKDDEAPPIVIMKPLHLPILEREVRRDLLLDEIPVQEEAYSHNRVREKKQSIQLVGEESSQLVKEEKVLDHGRMLSKKLERKEVRSMEKTKLELPQKVKSQDSVYQKLEGKETIKTRKKSSVGTKPVLNGGKIEEKKDVKTIKAPVSQAKASTTLAKPYKKGSAVKNNVSTHTSAPRNCKQGPPTKPRHQNSSMSNEKKIVGPKPGRIVTKGVNTDKKCKEIAEEIVPHDDMDSIITGNNILPDEETPERAHQDGKPCLKDDKRKDQELYCEVIPKISSLGENGPRLAEEVIQHSDKSPPGKASAFKVGLEHLLLSRQSFLSHAQQLLSPPSRLSLCYQTKGPDNLESKNDKLFLDCSEELIRCKIYQHDLLNHPMLQTSIPAPTMCISIDQLIEEVSSEIEEFSRYSKVVEEDVNNSDDSLYIRLGKDLRCKDILIDSMWDFGWVTWISIEESDQVVGAVEEFILSCLIEGIVIDLVS